MTNVVAVHGIGQQQSGRNQMMRPWLLALRDGIERAVGRNGPAIDLDMGFYGDLYAEAVRKELKLPDPSNAVEKKLGDPFALADDEIAFLNEIEAEIVDEELPPDEVKMSFAAVPPPVGRLAAWVDRHFGVAGRLLVFGDLVQVRRYQRDDELASKIRACVREAIAEDTRVLIGHSLGSVVAYETLCLDPQPGVQTLVTLGSPLGLATIQKALRTHASPPVAHWVNVYDVRDPVACGGALKPTWPAVSDFTVDNGDDPHAALHYLGKQPTGQAVVTALSPP
jgi:hypothetical protein